MQRKWCIDPSDPEFPGSGYLRAADALSNDRIALTTHRSETLGIQNRDLASADLDQAGALEESRRDSDTCSPRCEQSRDQVMREIEHVGLDRIASDEQPPAQTFLEGVVAVADARLRNLDEKRICVF